MTSPIKSHLPETTRNRVLRLAEQLRRASDTVGRLASGGSTVARNHLGVGGRLGDQSIATRRWTGPHRETFDSLFAEEMEAASAAERQLAIEAEAWRRFWTMTQENP